MRESTPANNETYFTSPSKLVETATSTLARAAVETGVWVRENCSGSETTIKAVITLFYDNELFYDKLVLWLA